MLVTSIFSFSHNVLKRLLPQACQKLLLCGNGLEHGSFLFIYSHPFSSGFFYGPHYYTAKQSFNVFCLSSDLPPLSFCLSVHKILVISCHKVILQFYWNFINTFIMYWSYARCSFQLSIPCGLRIMPSWTEEILNKLIFFSSSEHNVLRVSYCDWSLSDVRPSVHLSIHVSVLPSVYEQLLKKSSPLKTAYRFQWNFTEMIPGWCTFRKLQRYEFREELWLPWQLKEKTLKIFLTQTVRARAFMFGM